MRHQQKFSSWWSGFSKVIDVVKKKQVLKLNPAERQLPLDSMKNFDH